MARVSKPTRKNKSNLHFRRKGKEIRDDKEILDRLLEGIGPPDPEPFKPDKFQLEALKAIEKFDVLVTAPTGSGKTWIAKEEIRRLLSQGKRAWYTTPLKALTNSKYIEFCEEFGSELVGILTGDRKENTKAPIIVGTTEIYRNQLFDALRKGENVNTDFVILDEAHYLSDDERGHVWEEAIILTPPRIRLLLLSATIGNPEELARWIEEVRASKVKIIKAYKRPVELRAACILPNLKLIPLFGNESKSHILRSPEISPPILLNALRNFNLLPAIVFLPTRKRCDEAAIEFLNRKIDREKRQKRKEFIREFEKLYPEIKDHRHKNLVIQAGVASHHAGHLPAWKLLVEKMMSAGLLDAIFATTTVAAGVDFPARTVVIVNADTRSGEGWRPLEVNELQQMTGRAGRRGKDKVGFIVVAPSFFQDPVRIAHLLRSAPDPLLSKFRATYLSLLNLLDAYDSFNQVRQIAEKSFFWHETASQILKLEQQNWERLAKLKKAWLDFKKHIEKAAKPVERNSGVIKSNGSLDLEIDNILGYERLISVRQRLFEQRSYEEDLISWLKENVRPGRIISKKAHGNKFLMVLKVTGDKVIAMKENGRGTTLNVRKIKRIFANEYSFDKMIGPRLNDEFSRAFSETAQGKNPLLERPDNNSRENHEKRLEAIQMISNLLEKIVNDLSDSLTNKPKSENLSSFETSDSKNSDLNVRKEVEQFLIQHLKDVELIQRNEKAIESLRETIWLPFEKRAKVLAHFGYIDFSREKVTELGKWLADLRVERPLLVGQALRHINFSRVKPHHFAAFIGALAADRERIYDLNPSLELENETLKLLTSLEKVALEVARVELKYGIQPETEINFSAAAAVEKWALGIEWKELVRKTQAEEGDLVRLLSRTGEVLLQISHLKNLTQVLKTDEVYTQDDFVIQSDRIVSTNKPERAEIFDAFDFLVETKQGISELSSAAAKLILREPVR